MVAGEGLPIRLETHLVNRHRASPGKAEAGIRALNPWVGGKVLAS